jgi:serine/threonine protein kinase
MNSPKTIGRYRLAHKIGSGGTSEIFKAYLEAEGGFCKAIAIKRLLEGFCGNEEIKDLIMDEAKVLTHLCHNTIVQVFDYGCESGVPYIAMEYVDGLDCAYLLNRLIKKGMPLPPEHALYIVDQVLVALDFAHRCRDETGRPLGVIHRDISPSNILLSWAGEVKIADFGIARGSHRTRLTQTGRVRGKYSYMSPEQASGGVIDERADLFAVAVVLFELVTAQRLFDAENDLEVIGKVRNIEVPWDVIRKLPPAIRAILLMEFSDGVDSRFLTASEMLMDVRGAERTIGSVVSSIEMSLFLADEFEKSGLGGFQNEIVFEKGAAQSTAIISRKAPRLTKKAASLIRAAVVLLVLMLFMSISRGERGSAGQVSKTSAKHVTDIVTLRQMPVLRNVAKAVAITTEPSGAKVLLKINGELKTFISPFVIEGIESNEDISCVMEISKPGYGKVSADFTLDETSPQFVKNFALEKIRQASLLIHAKPWGVISVEGRISKKEAPVRIVPLNPGSYDIIAEFPPQKKRLEKKITIAEGSSHKCLASFTDNSFTCR